MDSIQFLLDKRPTKTFIQCNLHYIMSFLAIYYARCFLSTLLRVSFIQDKP